MPANSRWDLIRALKGLKVQAKPNVLTFLALTSFISPSFGWHKDNREDLIEITNKFNRIIIIIIIIIIIFQRFLIAQHVSSDTKLIIRSSKTVIATSVIAGSSHGWAGTAVQCNYKRM